jgi:sorbitol-specific phosphotransferase system component IIBC
MEFVAVFIAAVLGWQVGTLGARELKAIAIVVLGWTTVTTLASLPYISVEGVLTVLAFRTLLIAVPYTLGMLLKRWRRGRS